MDKERSVSKKKTAIADILVFLLSGLLGWCIVIIFGSTGPDNKFQDPLVHWASLIIGLIHLTAGVMISIMLYKKERTRYRIRIGKGLLVYDLLMTLFPYLYLAFVLVWPV